MGNAPETGKAKSIVLALVGDLMLGRGVNDLISTYPPEHFWGTTLPLLQATDAVFGNLECAITIHEQPWRETFKVFHFRAGPGAVPILKVANIKAVTLANNHSLDFEEVGLLDTLQYLDQAGIKHAGAGRDIAAARIPAFLIVKGMKIGFISATDNEPPFAADTHKPGTNYLEINTRPETLKHLQEDINKARLGGAELIILSLHWGPNMVDTPSKDFQEFAHKAIDLGVDIIHGHSAHVFQGVEYYKNGVIFYDTGDFVDDYAVDPVLRNDWSFIFMIELAERRIKSVNAIPVRLQYAQTNLARGAEAQAINSRMQELCSPFGTKVEAINGNLLFSKAKN
jgi:poly-gamma-glutamate synthesis protein (capsule biosynthesis protein)